jgi:hypothetical protein
MINDIVLEPVGGEFDVSAIRAHLESLPNVVRDPANPAQYLMASDVEVLREGVGQRREHAERVPYTLTIVAPTASRILLAFRSADTAPARAFVQWLRERLQIRILDEDFNDFTTESLNNLDFLFGPESAS